MRLANLFTTRPDRERRPWIDSEEFDLAGVRCNYEEGPKPVRRAFSSELQGTATDDDV